MFIRLVATFILLIISPIFIIISLSIIILDGWPIFFSQKRIGKDDSYFKMFKFRTMKIETPDVATHLLENPKSFVFPLGSVLRKMSLDELPNLINIMKEK